MFRVGPGCGFGPENVADGTDFQRESYHPGRATLWTKKPVPTPNAVAKVTADTPQQTALDGAADNVGSCQGSEVCDSDRRQKLDDHNRLCLAGPVKRGENTDGQA